MCNGVCVCVLVCVYVYKRPIDLVLKQYIVFIYGPTHNIIYNMLVYRYYIKDVYN